MSEEPILATARMALVAAKPQMVRADLSNRAELGLLLNAAIPQAWPPPLVDAAALQWILKSVEADPDCLLWCARYFVLKEPRVVIGLGGFKGRPDATGTVEIGYSVLEQFQRCGYGTEAAAALCKWAFSHEEVRCVTAETFPHLTGSISVLKKNQFRLTGAGSEGDTIRFELARDRAATGLTTLT
ncbi:MAG: acetyltransferase, ribosomal protein N-acetylase [Pedosphaera sp.]|nr:acetyltransferase, ribosomal protein N-acetylase [Pedosphaera sp.]